MLLSLNLLLRTPIVTRLSPFFSFSFPNIQQNKLDSKVQEAKRLMDQQYINMVSNMHVPKEIEWST